jgi:hypothetical protein
MCRIRTVVRAAVYFSHNDQPTIGSRSFFWNFRSVFLGFKRLPFDFPMSTPHFSLDGL